MQLMPKTGRVLGVSDIYKAEPNVHGGAKYMAQLMDDYFKDVPIRRTEPQPVRFRRVRRKSLTRMCGSTMSSGWQQRG